MTLRWSHLGRFVVSFFIVATVFGNPLAALSDDTRVHLISTPLPGGQLEMKGGEIVGAYAAFFREASRRSGAPINFRIVPWVRAVAETENSDDMLLFPFTRTGEREHRFSWVALLREDPMCFVSVGVAINTLEEARSVKRIIVWRGTSHQAFLEQQGFQNLIVVAEVNKIIQILNAAHDAACYFPCERAQSYLDPDKSEIVVKLGTPVASETIWLAGGKSFVRTPAANSFAAAIDVLHGEKLLEKLLGEIAK
jgi:polar amino acid transport system substrate-binding protein